MTLNRSPVSMRYFRARWTLAYAAAVVGLETEVFLEKIRENVGLQNAGLLVLDSANGSMKRDAWTSNFRDIVFALNFPTAVVVPPIVTPPEQKPDAVVQIPDPNLRAAIAEALGKNPNALITIADMEKLAELDMGDHARSRGIRNLTGLEFATNLNVSYTFGIIHEFNDLSPIAGLINLRVYNFWQPQSDLSLTLSPLAGLINLRNLHMNDSKVSDLSPLAGLIKLDGYISILPTYRRLSPIAGLITNLERCCTWGSPTSIYRPWQD